MSRASQQEALALRRRELRAQLDLRRQAARATMLVRRQQAAAALAQRRAAQPTKKRERRWWPLVLLVLLALLLMVSDCSCQRAPEATGAVPPVAAEPAAAAPPSTPLPPAGRVNKTSRPAYPVAAPAALPWLGAFRLQVAARSPRLAACFVGAPRPGTLKWSAAVEPVHGVVSDHSLEPTLSSEALSQEQRSCVLGVLSDPPYKLDGGDARATPSRVGIAIEF